MYNNISDWDRMIAGNLYNSDSPDIQKQHFEGMCNCEDFNNTSIREPEKKQAALEKLIPSSVGKNLGVFSPFYCEYGVNIHVGNFCFFNYNCTVLDVSTVTLGDNVWVGANVTIATPNHPYLAEERLAKEYPDGSFHDLEYSDPITIKDNCWICSGAVICGGVTIGENSIVAAGAVVTRDVPPNSIVGGTPAKVIRSIDEKDRINVWDAYLKNEKPLSIRKKEILNKI